METFSMIPNQVYIIMKELLGRYIAFSWTDLVTTAAIHTLPVSIRLHTIVEQFRKWSTDEWVGGKSICRQLQVLILFQTWSIYDGVYRFIN